MNFYKHHLGDYARDTKDLSLLEHGAYRVLLDHNYAHRAADAERSRRSSIASRRATPAERKAVQEVADRFFPVNGDGGGTTSAPTPRSRSTEKSRRPTGSSAEEREANDASAIVERWHATIRACERIANGNANQNQKPERTKASPADAGEGRDDVAAVPDCPHEKLIALYHELLPTCTQVVEWNDQRKAIARARWREKAQRSQATARSRTGSRTGGGSSNTWPARASSPARRSPDRSQAVRGDARVAAAAEELREGRRGELPPMSAAARGAAGMVAVNSKGTRGSSTSGSRTCSAMEIAIRCGEARVPERARFSTAAERRKEPAWK
jgi:uncharacterized protein YdaU (DUF1376 family)